MSTHVESIKQASEPSVGRDLGEPDAHAMSRHLATTIRVALILCVIATLVLFVFYRPAAYLAAIPVPLLAVALMLVDLFERRSRSNALRKPNQTEIGQDEVELDVEVAGLTTAVKAFAVLAVGTFIIAAAYFEAAILGIAATAVLLLALLIELPFILVGVSEAKRDEREKITGKRD
tara:strand:+ start:123214 stop:123741 length:528 start_codon:yes stop_codon:yes gene_type:complete